MTGHDRPTVSVRTESAADHRATFEVVQRAFGRHAEARLVDALRRSPAFSAELSLVAERNGRIVGHLLFSRITVRTPTTAVAALALAPLSVHPDFQNQGIGMQLTRAGLDRCRRLGHTLVIVLGHRKYYPRFGFTPARPQGITAPFPLENDDAFMVLELVPGALRDVSGVVEYPPPFFGPEC
jgi:putative acetyltransferase